MRVTQDMEKRNSYRLTAMERSQAKTNRRPGDVQDLLQSFMNSFLSSNVTSTLNRPRSGSNKDPEISNTEESREKPVVGNSSGIGSSERWWDRLCKSTDEEDNVEGRTREEDMTILKTLSKCTRILWWTWTTVLTVNS